MQRIPLTLMVLSIMLMEIQDRLCDEHKPWCIPWSVVPGLTPLVTALLRVAFVSSGGSSFVWVSLLWTPASGPALGSPALVQSQQRGAM